MSRGNSLGMMPPGPAGRRAIEIVAVRPVSAEPPPTVPRVRSYMSYFAPMSAFSLLSFGSVFAIGSFAGLASVASLASVGSAFSVSSIGSIFSVNSVLSVGCYDECMRVCVGWFEEVSSGHA